MLNKCKTLVFLVCILAAPFLVFVNSNHVNAQTVPASTPFPVAFNSSIAIPQFTLQLADHSIDVPTTTTTTTDPYTGNTTITTQPGYHVENKTIDLIIINQPHVPVVVPNDYSIDLYYKGHFGDNWTELYNYDSGDNRLPKATNSTNTIISIPQRQFSSNAQVDFQIRAINGKINIIHVPFFYWTYQASGWSNIETLNMTDGSVTITLFTNPTFSPSPTFQTSPPTPSVPEYSWFAIVPLLLSLIPVALIVRQRKNANKNP